MLRNLFQRLSPDVRAVLLLLVLWFFFFWRVLTPYATDRLVFAEGDFTGQFVAFAAYQYERFAQGEVPLWNPYNNSGLPFIADTQAAVFYPPRLVTLALAALVGGFSQALLQLEALVHVLLLSLFMYLFVRRLTQHEPLSLWASLCAALVIAYGGYITGYPPLQLALLEAGIWFPVAAWAILRASETEHFQWRWMWLAGVLLGISWMAGHPQTSWFMTYWLVAWWAYRAWQAGYAWRVALQGLFILGSISIGITAVTLLPGFEYLRFTSRAEMSISDKGNGFPFQDLFQTVLPASVSLFSPLYIGILPLLLLGLALWRWQSSRFWFISAAFGLLLSFGAHTAFYDVLYLSLAGLSFFRGQERAAFFVAYSAAILSAYGLLALPQLDLRPLRRYLLGFSASLGLLAVILFVAWLGFTEAYQNSVGVASFSALLALGAAGLLWQARRAPSLGIWSALIAWLVLDLFSHGMNAPSNYIPAKQALSLDPPSHVQRLQADANAGQPFRVDGYRGLQDNFGSLYQVMDMRGISPLFLTSAGRIIYANYVNNPLAWELFAVKYIYSERESFASLATQVIEQGTDRQGQFYLHQISNPRPFAHLVYQAVSVDSDEFALALLNDPRFDPRQEAIILGDWQLPLTGEADPNASAQVVEFLPERIVVRVQTRTPAILTLAQVHYAGWHASLNQRPVPLLRAYGALSALAIPAGDHELVLDYQPLSYQIGASLSLITWGITALLALTSLARLGGRRRKSA